MIKGSVTINEITLNSRDALGIYDTNSFDILATEDAELLAVEVPMEF